MKRFKVLLLRNQWQQKMLLRRERKHGSIAFSSHLKRLLLTGILMSPLNLALGQSLPSPGSKEESVSASEIVQESLPEVLSQEISSHLKLQVSDRVSYEILLAPDLEQMKNSLGLILPEKLKAELLARGEKIEEINPLAGYQGLSLADQQKFQQTRLEFLKNAARIFNSTQFAFGVGNSVGRSFSFIKEKVQTLRGRPQSSPSEYRSFAEASHQTAQNLLQSLDYKLWSQAPLLIASNEYGISASLGLAAGRGFLRNGNGGAEELGISLGYNKESRAFVFEIFHNSERFKNAPGPLAWIGIPYKAGTFIAHRNLGAETSTVHGESFYPPAIPGFSSGGPEFFSGGMNSSISLPPSPFVDLMTFTNHFDRNSIIRITISPIVTGFVRMQFGDIKGSISLLTTRVTNITTAVAKKIKSASAPRCASIFN